MLDEWGVSFISGSSRGCSEHVPHRLPGAGLEVCPKISSRGLTRPGYCVWGRGADPRASRRCPMSSPRGPHRRKRHGQLLLADPKRSGPGAGATHRAPVDHARFVRPRHAALELAAVTQRRTAPLHRAVARGRTQAAREQPGPREPFPDHCTRAVSLAITGSASGARRSHLRLRL